MIWMILSASALAGVTGLAIWLEGKWKGTEREKNNLDIDVAILQKSLRNERAYSRETYLKHEFAEARLESVSAANKDHAYRTHQAAKDLESMTDQRDELLARVIFDDTELETVFEDIEDATEFLAKRKRAMESIRRVVAANDMSGPEWDDTPQEEEFVSAKPEETTKARDELMVGFDDPKAIGQDLDIHLAQRAIPWYENKKPDDEMEDEGKL